MVLLASIFLQQALSGPSSSAYTGSDLLIILICLAILTGMVYLFKFVLEKCGVARKREMISSTFSEKENP